MIAEALGVDRGRGDDDLEVRAAGQQLLEVAEDEVDVQAALVRFVDDERVVAEQLPVALQLGEQDAVGHHLDQRAVAGRVGEAHLVADRGTQLGAEFAGDPLRDGARRDPPRLGVPDLPGDPPAELEADLGELGGLPGARLTGDDHHLVIPDGRGDLVLALADRELRRVAQHGHAGPAGLGLRRRRLHLGEHPVQRLLPRAGVGQRGSLLGAAAEPALIPEHQPGQPAAKLGERGGHGGTLHGTGRQNGKEQGRDGRVPGCQSRPCLPNAFARQQLPRPAAPAQLTWISRPGAR